MEQDRITKGIWFPIEIWENKDLTWNEKILLLDIDSYTSKNKDCFFSNKYIADLLDVNETTANKILSSLIKKGYVVKTKFDGRKRYIKSTLELGARQGCEKVQGTLALECNIPNNIVTNNDDIKKENKEKLDFDLSFVMPEFLPIVQDWFAYKKEKKQTYKERGAKMFYTQLINLSESNVEIARLIIEQSMANNWAGIFPLKNRPKTQPMPKCQNDDEVVIGGQTYK